MQRHSGEGLKPGKMPDIQCKNKIQPMEDRPDNPNFVKINSLLNSGGKLLFFVIFFEILISIAERQKGLHSSLHVKNEDATRLSLLR
jgi:hypothetical protein